MTEQNYFEHLIGQEALKRKLGFYLDAFNVTSRMPFLLFSGAKGFGKTLFAREVAQCLKNRDGSPRRFLELNSSILRNNEMFFENIFLQYIHGKPITILFDECHNLPKDLSQALLTICNTEKESVRDFSWSDSTYTFDFTKITFLFATTEPDRIFAPLKDRFEVVDFEAYSKQDMIDMVLLHSKADEDVRDDFSVDYEYGVLDHIADHIRGNARSCVKIASNIKRHCSSKMKDSFNRADWDELCHSLDIKPFGLTSSEIIILKELNERGACSLNMLASATGMSRSAIQRDVEQYLMKKDFLRVDGKRKITDKGQKVLELL